MNRLSVARATALAACAAPLLAFAHGAGAPHDHGTLSALAAGFTHPFTGLDHLAAMAALGLWSAVATRRIWAAPLSFAVALLAGALMGLAGIPLPAVEPMIATSLLVLGLLLATGRQLPVAAGVAIAAVFAVFHGAAHGSELAGPGAAAALTGMVAATVLLHGLGLAAGVALRERHRWLPRVAGAAVALFGVALFAPLA